jgi:hypothetical protein
VTYIPDTAGVRSFTDFAPADYGFKAWTFDPMSIQGGTLLASANGTLTLIKFKASGTPITNLHMHFTAGATGAVAGQCLFALYTAAGALLPTSVSADQSGNLGGGFKTFPLGAPQATLTNTFYYGAFFINVTTTMPTMSRALNSSTVITNPNLSVPNLRYATTADVGLTTAFPSTLGAQTGSATATWMAAS